MLCLGVTALLSLPWGGCSQETGWWSVTLRLAYFINSGRGFYVAAAAALGNITRRRTMRFFDAIATGFLYLCFLEGNAELAVTGLMMQLGGLIDSTIDVGISFNRDRTAQPTQICLLFNVVYVTFWRAVVPLITAPLLLRHKNLLMRTTQETFVFGIAVAYFAVFVAYHVTSAVQRYLAARRKSAPCTNKIEAGILVPRLATSFAVTAAPVKRYARGSGQTLRSTPIRLNNSVSLTNLCDVHSRIRPDRVPFQQAEKTQRLEIIDNLHNLVETVCWETFA